MSIYQKGKYLFDSNKGSFFSLESVEPNSIDVEKILETVIVNVEEDVEILEGTDKVTIDLTLKTKDGPVPSLNGFLIEVFYSGSDGVLQRAYRDDTVDTINDDIIEEGFEKYIKVDVDVD